MRRLTADELEVMSELVELDYLTENAADQWQDPVEFPTLVDWVTHYVEHHMTKTQLRLVARHFLVTELSAMQDGA